ncbi:hypothetical protein M9H77_26396 [Catharanthus roseus]|uniref:Uncharacterized protein n=1 Tax=Catharanthus roseus TaxID=4058 RepID=A0ACC0AC82_CATRO|nr:hypothetical protein M9H77_26396 [Catharanthus roseus]
MQGRLFAWLVKHGLIHRSLGFDYQGIETLQIKSEDWHSIAVILYVYGYNYLCSQCAYDVAPDGLLGSAYHLTRIEHGVDQPEERGIYLLYSFVNLGEEIDEPAHRLTTFLFDTAVGSLIQLGRHKVDTQFMCGIERFLEEHNSKVEVDPTRPFQQYGPKERDVSRSKKATVLLFFERISLSSL